MLHLILLVVDIEPNIILYMIDTQSNMVSPFAAHQQQLAMLAQQQQLLMAAAAQASNGASKPNIQQPGLNGANMPTQNWANAAYQFPGLTIPSTGQNDMQQLAQVKFPLMHLKHLTCYSVGLLKRTYYYISVRLRRLVTLNQCRPQGILPPSQQWGK